MADHSPLIEQIEDWRDLLLRLETSSGREQIIINTVVRGMNDVVTDLRREEESEVRS